MFENCARAEVVLEGTEMTIDKAISEIIDTNYGEVQCHQETMVLAVAALREKAEREKGCHGCKHRGNYEDEIEYGYACPCLLCSRRSLDNYKPYTELCAAPGLSFERAREIYDGISALELSDIGTIKPPSSRLQYLKTGTDWRAKNER